MTDVLPAVTPPGRADDVLERELVAARQSPTRRLPPERELAERSGLSRTAVRRWLDDLERSGAVTRHVGRGTFLRPEPVPEPGDASPAEIMSARLLLEPQLLGLAVASATSVDVETMRHCLRQGEAAGGFEEFEHWDAALHRTVAQSTHNGLVVRLYEVLAEARDSPTWGSAKRRSFTDERRRDYEHDHRAIVEAIADRDAAAATAVMRRHLLRIRSTLLGD